MGAIGDWREDAGLKPGATSAGGRSCVLFRCCCLLNCDLETKQEPPLLRKNGAHAACVGIIGRMGESIESLITDSKAKRYFLLSPANLAGRRAKILLRPEASFELAARLRRTGAPLGDIFSFISGLYFRGKLAYATAFAEPAGDVGGAMLIITATHGLLPPSAWVRTELLNEMAEVPINCTNPRYRVPLERDATRLASQMGPRDEVVLLGSIATPKYVEPLSNILGERLLFPDAFVGRGDMSRGALMLRAARDGVQLTYVPVTRLEFGARKRAKAKVVGKARKGGTKKTRRVSEK
jgi:hypothetical protein